MLAQELGLVAGHVDVDRAVGLAALARQTQVQGLADLRRPPAALDDLAGGHLEQQASPAAGGVLLLPGYPVAGAHDAALGGQAPPDTHAPSRRADEAVAVVGERQSRATAQGGRGDEDTEVVVQPGGVDDAVGVHEPVGVERPLELRERGEDVRRVHTVQQLRPGLAVAVLAGERAAVLGDQVGGLLDEPPEVGDSPLGEQVEVDADVDAAVAEVPVVDALPTVLLHERVEATQVRAEPVRRDGGVLPAGPRLTAVGQSGRAAGAVLANAPQRSRLRRVGDDQAGGAVLLHRSGDLAGALLGLGRRLPTGLHVEPRAAGRQAVERGVRRVPGPHDVDDRGVDAFDRQRAKVEEGQDVVGGHELVGEAEDDERPGRRRLDQADLGLQDRGARALGAHESLRQVEAGRRQELVQVVAGDSPGEGGVRRAGLGRVAVQLLDPRTVLVTQGAQCPVEPTDPPGFLAPSGELLVGGGAHGEPGSVGEDHVEGGHVVDGLAPRDRVGAARVVADHAAEGAAVVGGRVRSERQAVPAGRPAQVVEHDARLDARPSAVGVDLQDRVEVAAEVEHDRGVDRLAADAGAGAARQDRDAEAMAHLDRGEHVVGVVGLDHSDRHVPVVGGVRAPHGTARGVEAHGPTDDLGQLLAQGRRVNLRFRGLRGSRHVPSLARRSPAPWGGSRSRPWALRESRRTA